MKKYWLIAGILLIGVIFGAVIILNQTNEKSIISNTQGSAEPYALDTTLPKSPANAPLYKVISVDSISEGKPELMNIKNSIPSESEASKLAEKVLAEYGGLPHDAKLSLVEQVTIKKYNGKSGIIEEEYPQWTSVHYKQDINGLQVIGPGAGIVVNLGENGEMLGISKGWRTLEYAGEVPVISVEEAYQKLKNGETLIVYQSSPIGLRISDIQLGYYAEDIREDQKYYTPVWLFYAGKEGQKAFPRPVDAVKK